MSLEMMESGGIKAMVGTMQDIRELDENTIQGALGKIVHFVTENIHKAYHSDIPEMKEMSIANFISMTLSNIIINTISGRLASDDKDRRMFIMNRFLDELKDITLRCFEECEENFEINDEKVNKNND